ncbi:hypothetical protein [Pseudonocardia lacus]|uniref:hypothetical protein n=1 Tax=Pseudonocardia lacus TaxID=2835865 RepID=UPI001BDC899A|nr:hypothetical protein [Pseudonocardia lacus]
MIDQAAVHVRLRRSGAVSGSGLTLGVERETPFGELRTWPSWDVASIDVGFPGTVSDTAPVPLVAEVADALRQVLGDGPGTALLLSIDHPDLNGLAWEELGPTLQRQVVRYGPTLAARAYDPADVPLSILLVDVDDVDGRVDVISRYFRSVATWRQTGGGIERLIGSGHFDVVHLVVQVPDQDSGSVRPEVRHVDGSVIDTEALARALELAGTRLVVLESAPHLDGSPGRLTDALRSITHDLHETTGIAAIASGPARFRDFYHDLTHDTYLTDLVHAITPTAPEDLPALWVRRGGDSAVRLHAAGSRLSADVIDEHHRVDAAYRARLTELGWPIGAPTPEPATLDVLQHLSQLRERTYSYSQETLGVIPMSETQAELNELQRIRATQIPEPARVLNAWVQSHGQVLPPQTSLAADTTYELAVMIGRPDRRSAVIAPARIDESVVADAYVDDTAELTVVVSSADVVVDRPRTPLRLPRPPADSETVLVAFTAPSAPGNVRLRVAVHHGTNLLQSLMVTLAVEQTEQAGGPGYQAELEWALSSTFQNLDEMDQPTLNIVTNEDPRGGHTFVVYGAGDAATPDIHRQLDIAPGQLKTAVDDARRDLQSACATLRNGELDKYRYRDGRVDIDRLLGDLRTLALCGSGLFGELVSGADESFNDQLENRLRGSRLIQIAAVRSANYVLPWNLVYDHEFRMNRSNALCSNARSILAGGGTGDDLAMSQCFCDECPYRDDPTVVCPSGFWGFRHRIEQPLLTSPAIEPVDSRDEGLVEGTPRHDVTTRIPLQHGMPLHVVIGVSETCRTGHTTRDLSHRR